VREVVDSSVLTSLWNRIPDMLFSSWMWMVGAGAGVLVLVLGLLMFLRRRQSIAEFEESILSGSALDSYSETTDTAGTSASDTSFLSDFGTAGMGTMQADEVDPLAEAEVYLAYGRDEQAEDVLKEAARRDPDRSEIKLKLLEIYKQRNDVKSFETIAEELYPAGDQGDAEVWSKVTAMGREVNPGNPLFQESGAPGAAGTTGGARATQPAAAAAPRAPRPANVAGATALGLTGSEGASDTASTPARGATPTQPRELEAADLDLGLDEAPAASPAAHHDEDVLDFGDDFLERTSGNVDPSTQPFPTPDQQTDLDQELERLAGERKVVAPDTLNTAGSGVNTDGAQTLPREVAWDKADADTSTLNFPTSDNSEIEFDLNLDESSIQQLSAGDTREGSKATRQSAGGGRSSGNGEGLMEFESDNIPPEETWAGPSTDATPSREDDTVAYTPSEDVHSSAAPQYNEADTKLDLARAYLDMGDKVGARSIIDEVMREGNPAQRDQAAELAAQL
jgi:pilus assembly protein FimV